MPCAGCQTISAGITCWVVAAYSLFALYVGLSRYGDIKLGQDHDKPDFPFLTWAAMLFSAGIGIDLLFFGASEPLPHYLTSTPDGAAARPKRRVRFIAQAFLHWGLHGWGIYALIGMALAYFAYRQNLPLALRSALVPAFGRRRTDGWLKPQRGYFRRGVHALALPRASASAYCRPMRAWSHVFGIETSKLVQTVIIVAVVAAAALSAMSGVERGVRRLSEINMLCIFLLIALLVMGPTVFLLKTVA